MPDAPALVAIGHVSRDEFDGDGEWRLGGSALYAAATAARLGTRAALVTRVGPHEAEPLRAACASFGIALHALPAEMTTTFVLRYVDGHRQLRLRARARGIAVADVPAALLAAPAVVLGSIAHEIDASLFGAVGPARVVVTAQGFLREWSADGTIGPRAWTDAEAVVRGARAVVLSEEDVAGDLTEPRRWARHGAVIVTLAERGALVLSAGAETTVPGYTPACVVDPTGAGDAFAAGLAIALAEGTALMGAVGFANAVASFAVEGVGMDGLADRRRVAERMRG